jgi:glycosyltransferase involved in cell wall biosynthesis
MTDQLGQSQVIPYLRELTKLGYQFTLLSVEKKDRLAANGAPIRQLLNEIGIAWETLTFTTQPPVLSKIYDQYKLNVKARQLHSENKFDMIHCRSYVAAAAGLKLMKQTAVPFLFDMRGFWVNERVDSGHWNLRNPLYRLFYRIYKKKEQKYFNGATHIISLTEIGKEELIKTYQVPAQKITVIPCCADLEHFDYHIIGENEKQKLKQSLGIKSNEKVLSYLGSLGGWYMTDEMLDFFAVLKKRIPEAKFFFITKDNRDDIITKAEARGISSGDIILQSASRNEVPLFLSISDWSIFFIKDLYSKKASSPTKQGEIMGMGIPMICNDIGDTGYIVKKAESGVVIHGFTQKDYNLALSALDKFTASEPAGQAGKSEERIRRSAYDFFDLKKGIEQYSIAYQIVLL